MFKTQIQAYLQRHSLSQIQLKGVMFDMDGVLFNSMPFHTTAWHNAMKRHGLHLSKEEAYLHEGRTGAGTIQIVMRREQRRDATPEEIEAIYHDKSEEFNRFPLAPAMPGALQVVRQVRQTGLTALIVTGSGQKSLLSRIEENYPALFNPDFMVTAFDVKHGKPHPEPYLIGLRKSHLLPHEALVVENAPMGVEAGHAAGVFTIAVNTGPMPDEALIQAGADVLFHSMQDFADHWKDLYEAICRTTLKPQETTLISKS